MFRMLGKKVELYRYKIVYTENAQEIQDNCISAEHKNEIEQMLTSRGVEFITTIVIQTANEWFGGLEFNSYDEALEVFNLGEQAYIQKLQLSESTDGLQLRADVDYIAIMSGVTM